MGVNLQSSGKDMTPWDLLSYQIIFIVAYQTLSVLTPVFGQQADADDSGAAGGVNRRGRVGEVKLAGAIHKKHAIGPGGEQIPQACIQFLFENGLRIDLE